MADAQTTLFLKQHGLDSLVPIFTKERLHLADFKYLRDNRAELQQLVPNMRDRIDFLAATTENVDKSTQVEMDRPIIARETLKEICERYDSGRKFLELYSVVDGVHMYPPESRKLIKKALVEHFFVLTKGHITHIHFMEMTQIVINELPDEDPRTWYIPVFQNKSAGGLLYNAYRYLQATDKRYKQQKKQQNEPGPSQVIEQGSWSTLNDEQRATCEAAKAKLKVTGYTDSETITSCWKNSFPLRREEALTGRILFKDWEVLSHFANIYDLINYDFQKVFSANDTFASYVPRFVQNFRKVFETHRNLVDEDPELCTAIATNFVDNVQICDSTVFLGFYALPLILRQQFTAKEKKRAKVSLFACRAAYIVLVETEAKIMETVTLRRRAALDMQTTVQPYIIVVGKIHHTNGYYVILDELTFKCGSMLAAVDLHFKLHTVFHVTYAKECEAVMEFIQIFFYGVSFPGERLDAAATALATDFKRL